MTIDQGPNGITFQVRDLNQEEYNLYKKLNMPKLKSEHGEIGKRLVIYWRSNLYFLHHESLKAKIAKQLMTLRWSRFIKESFK